MDALVPAILEQKVTGKEAFASHRRLVRRYGEPAPGAEAAAAAADGGARPRSSCAPIPSWTWLQLGVDHARSRTLRAGACRSRRRSSGSSTCRSRRRTAGCARCPGIGVWTSAEVRARALGDADAVSFGDYHVAKDIGWAMTGKPVDDEQLAVLLEPYRPHRLRVQVLVGQAGLRRPRRGPRMTLPHLPTRPDPAGCRRRPRVRAAGAAVRGTARRPSCGSGRANQSLGGQLAAVLEVDEVDPLHHAAAIAGSMNSTLTS